MPVCYTTSNSAAIPGPSRLTTGTPSPSTFAATCDGVSRLSGCQPLVASTQTAVDGTCAAALTSTGYRPGVDTATTTRSARASASVQSSGGYTVISGSMTIPSAGCGSRSRQARTTAESYPVATAKIGYP